jgi:hypothetical protein
MRFDGSRLLLFRYTIIFESIKWHRSRSKLATVRVFNKDLLPSALAQAATIRVIYGETIVTLTLLKLCH